ncbi:hypothetical protein [Novipirellula galeiformis]|uniref:hypothetical protein n=1 Tax=Novipirellula galeiformis TaxID=2528004 RepID=UPI0011B43275|nr:hypothetical protein [Novipirellula galeiformis]
MLSRKQTLSNLQANLTWLQKQTEAKASRSATRRIDAALRASNLCCCCLDILECAPPSSIDVDRWLDRVSGRRSSLDRIEINFHKTVGNRHARALVAVTIEVVRAMTWVDSFDVGLLHVRMPATASRANLDKANEAKRERLKAIENRANTILGVDTPGSAGCVTIQNPESRLSAENAVFLKGPKRMKSRFCDRPELKIGENAIVRVTDLAKDIEAVERMVSA